MSALFLKPGLAPPSVDTRHDALLVLWHAISRLSSVVLRTIGTVDTAAAADSLGVVGIAAAAARALLQLKVADMLLHLCARSKPAFHLACSQNQYQLLSCSQVVPPALIRKTMHWRLSQCHV